MQQPDPDVFIWYCARVLSCQPLELMPQNIISIFNCLFISTITVTARPRTVGLTGNDIRTCVACFKPPLNAIWVAYMIALDASESKPTDGKPANSAAQNQLEAVVALLAHIPSLTAALACRRNCTRETCLRFQFFEVLVWSCASVPSCHPLEHLTLLNQ